MKNLILGLFILAIVALGANFFIKKNSPIGGSSVPFSFTSSSTTQATSTVGTYNWSSILSAGSARGYVAICNDSITSNDAVYLNFGTASTTVQIPAKPYGYRLASGDCYEMDSDKLFYGAVYGIASTATTTILTTEGKSY